jgi:type IV pilus assembly protein PilC
MPRFRCRVGTPEGAIAERFVSAANAAAAREALTADGITVFDIGQQAAGGRLGTLRKLATIQIGGEKSEETSGRLFGRGTTLRTADLLLLNQELAALVNAGLPLLKCVDILRTRRAGSLAGSMLDRIRRRIASGDALSNACRPEIERVGLPELFVTSVEVGEASGDLVTALRRYSVHLEKAQALRQRVRSAMTYPIVLLCVAGIVVVILMTLVIPQFASFYASSGAELPLTTRVLVSTATFVSAWGVVIAAVVAVGLFLFRRWARTDRGRSTLDAFNLLVPVIGPLRHRYYGLETVRTLSTLLRGGAPLVRALEVTAEGTSNRAFRARIETVAEQVSEGTNLHDAFDEQAILEPLGLEMVQVGESTGALEEMLEHVANTYDESLDRQVSLVVGMVEPAMLVVMGLLVAGILMSLYLPLFNTVQVVG